MGEMDDDSDSDYDRTKRALDLELEDRAVREEWIVQWQPVNLTVNLPVHMGSYCVACAVFFIEAI